MAGIIRLVLCLASLSAAAAVPGASIGSPPVPLTPPLPANGAATAQWTVQVDQPLDAPLDQAFSFWWDLNNTRRFIPPITGVRVDPGGNASYQAFLISQAIPFPTEPAETAARGAVTVVQRSPGFIRAHTTGLVVGPSGPAGAAGCANNARGLFGRQRSTQEAGPRARAPLPPSCAKCITTRRAAPAHNRSVARWMDLL
jgi:hypothetical protein